MFFLTQSEAQCSTLEQNTKNTTSPTTNVSSSIIVGQSFKACRTGQLDKITINATLLGGATSAQTTLSVASGASTSGGIIHTQPVTINASGDIEINLTQPVLVTNNQIYTFFFGGTGERELSR